MGEDKNIPEAKRPKIEHSTETASTKWQINAVLSDELTQPTEQCDVLVSEIQDRKRTSQLLTQLCQLMPFSQLNHLKRVHNSRIILCPLSVIEQFVEMRQTSAAIESVRDHLSQTFDKSNALQRNEHAFEQSLSKFLHSYNIPDDSISLLCQNVSITSVTSTIPILQWQYKDAMLCWPTKFHPNKRLERLYTGEMFSHTEHDFHSKIMDICHYLATELGRETCGIAIDPRTQSIVAIGFVELHRHPLMHCAMVLIDSVARTQMGGAWNHYFTDDVEAIYANNVDCASESTVVGVSPVLRQLIDAKFTNVHYGSERPRTVDEIINQTQELNHEDGDVNNLSRYGPYLCTGYDVYLSRAPCTMCSMALTHSRVRNIFFGAKHVNGGAICPLKKFQSTKALNHHFQVFCIKPVESN